MKSEYIAGAIVYLLAALNLYIARVSTDKFAVYVNFSCFIANLILGTYAILWARKGE